MILVGDRGAVTSERPEDQSCDCSGAWKPAAEEHPECPGFNDDEDENEIIMIIIILAFR